ncbi:hypothetical protein CONCODRAFT_7327 [Conidiobolus coronatus NRRL 28638]|uniref:Uncharacterized protein n=1 Tax=Conidiobolus coronatus (strain ATCC 28846 / CBS 209.66 / NRRL 28638) TaxID=796925 RepID=A0A137P514_CONC2|nr:hypothetical protein CONCODRAFT_7327 [Conidiobolus coronatus NRRL 28638]|eukprot:KXN70093.1 hypothetical protein CONCODRAFT_7327 [Conidiobolus coronatus NRRL 28638]
MVVSVRYFDANEVSNITNQDVYDTIINNNLLLLTSYYLYRPENSLNLVDDGVIDVDDMDTNMVVMRVTGCSQLKLVRIDYDEELEVQASPCRLRITDINDECIFTGETYDFDTTQIICLLLKVNDIEKYPSIESTKIRYVNMDSADNFIHSITNLNNDKIEDFELETCLGTENRDDEDYPKECLCSINAFNINRLCPCKDQRGSVTSKGASLANPPLCKAPASLARLAHCGWIFKTFRRKNLGLSKDGTGLTTFEAAMKFCISSKITKLGKTRDKISMTRISKK